MQTALHVEVVQIDGSNLGAFCLPLTAIIADLHAQLPVEGRFTFGGRALDDREPLAALRTNDVDAPLCIQLVREQSFALVPLGVVMRCSEPSPVRMPVEPPSAEPKKPKKKAIGISFGNTCCCVGTWNPEDDGPLIIPSLHDERTMPACVAFTETGVLIGEDAWVHSQSNPENTLFGALRLIGRTYHETDPKSFKYAADQNGKPIIVVNTAEGELRLHPEEISAMIFKKLKDSAEAHLGTTVDDAVITVPIHFDDSQRQMIKDAGAIAGLNVLRILNEPTAAAIAYGLDKSSNSNERNVLVYDMGGKTFNATVLSIEDGIFEVKATCGNMNLGGNDFDSRILDLCLWDIEQKYSRQNVEGQSRAISHLRSMCERAKRKLSTDEEAMIEAAALFGGVDYSCLLSRRQFEDLNMKYFQKSMEIIDTCLRDAGVSRKDVHDVVLVGGSTRVPKLRVMLQEMFEGKGFLSSINPEEVVALGAATQAAILTGVSSSVIHDLCIMEVTPLSVGLEVVGGLAAKIISRNTSYVGMTCTWLATFTTSNPYQAEALIRIFQGERSLVSDCDVLGEFLLPLSPAPRGVPVIEVVLDLDSNFNMQVTAEDKMSGTMKRLSLKLGRLSQANIDVMVTQAEQFRTEDELCREQLKKFHGIPSHTGIVKAVEGRRLDGWWMRLDAVEAMQTS